VKQQIAGMMTSSWLPYHHLPQKAGEYFGFNVWAMIDQDYGFS
jgi:hypothetical protein